VHFHSVPYLADTSQRKARALVERLVRHQFMARLWLVPFGEIQREVVLAVPAPLRVVVYRRLMGRIAEAIARQTGALALVTGESLGQVASQTLENLTTIAQATTMEVLRPLVGMDKDEITAEAARIGTLPISNIPDQDCCQLFTPKHPSTRVGSDQIVRTEEALPIEEMVVRASAAAVVEDLRFPVLTYPADRSA
jgi:thiamine biosynthesis protein ThiI